MEINCNFENNGSSIDRSKKKLDNQTTICTQEILPLIRPQTMERSDQNNDYGWCMGQSYN